MAQANSYYSGTAARDLDYLLALPEIDFDTWQDEPTPQEEVRRQPVPKKKVRPARGQSITGFAVVGYLFISMLLLLVVLSHLQLAVLSSEIQQFENQVHTLTEESFRLQAAHDLAFHTSTVERFAREELGMVNAVSGQMVFVESNSVDTARVVAVAQESDSGGQGFFGHLFGLLQAYMPFLR